MIIYRQASKDGPPYACLPNAFALKKCRILDIATKYRAFFSLQCAGWGTNPSRLVDYHIKVTEIEDSPCINVQLVDKHVITVAQGNIALLAR